MNLIRTTIFLFAVLLFTNCTDNQINLVEAKFQFESADTLFDQPFVDIDEWRDKPVRHRYVHGGFEGTNTRFSFYFPPEEKYEGRFFQYITPFPDNENISQGASGENDKIGFSISSGAYFVETNGGGKTDMANPRANDPTIGAYRANAASALFSRVVAKELFGGERPYGYSFGGSGGAYRTVGGIENTNGVWDGCVPYVLGSPVAIPNVFTVRMHAMRILKDKFPQIVDALEPGGSGDMYAGLNEEERSALEEVTKMGFPPAAWYGYKGMGIHGFLVLYPGVVMADQSYFNKDFWNKPGYLGYDNPGSFDGFRIQKKSKIKALIGYEESVKLGISEAMSDADRGSADNSWKNTGDKGEKPEAIQLDDIMPEIQFLGGDLIILSGEAAGASIQITKIESDKIGLAPTIPLAILAKIKPGDEVQVDNSNFLAVQTYHRHQDPGSQYPVWNQFRDADGNPVYPQRPMIIGPMFTMGAAGSLPTGKFEGKMILLGSLWDREAFPWQCDWYRQRVKENLGDKTDDNFRLWYTEHALHGDQADQLDDATHAVSYIGVLQQALRDLSKWVEKGIEPATTTNYKIVDGQVVVPSVANERAGIQPVVNVTINDTKRADILAGETVTFNATVEIPKGMGKLVDAVWDFDGSGEYKDPVDLSKAKVSADGTNIEITTEHTFSEAGTHFPVLRVVSERDGDTQTAFARIQNLDRVRVVVK
ncbi:PKD domain-containing protein [uncultured Draconibacterium sp.]|uniref:PKD domain-containing protein n=1 Tax=uncultured Draconibacterium sp. TaxID=1573823 RepID=UPI0029C66119|nr:PKD domain-containing protein [uncultured Draconibacterium sp.]